MNGSAIKLAINLVSSLGVSKVLNDIVKNNTTIETAMDAVWVRTGTFVLGTMIVGQASNHVNQTIDNFVNAFSKKDPDAPEAEEHPVVEHPPIEHPTVEQPTPEQNDESDTSAS